MKGKILGYSDADGGAISGDDGMRYRFAISDWRGAGVPGAGGLVDFDMADGRAIDIYPLAEAERPAPMPKTSPPPAAPAPSTAPSLWRAPMLGLIVTAALLIYIFLMPPTLFHPYAGNFKPLLLIGWSIVAIVWRNKRDFERTNQYGTGIYRNFGHVVGSGALDLIVGFAAIAGLIVGGFALLL